MWLSRKTWQVICTNGRQTAFGDLCTSLAHKKVRDELHPAAPPAEQRIRGEAFNAVCPPQSIGVASNAGHDPDRDIGHHGGTRTRPPRILRTLRAADLPSSVKTLATGLLPAPGLFPLTLVFIAEIAPVAAFAFPAPEEAFPSAFCSSSEKKNDFLPVDATFAPAPTAGPGFGMALPPPPENDLPRGIYSTSAPADLGESAGGGGGRGGGGGGGGTDGRGGADTGNGGCVSVGATDHSSAERGKGSVPAVVEGDGA